MSSPDPLADFFAKKDRAKNKADKKSSGEKAKPDKIKKAEKDPTAAITIKPLDNDDGEWKEIEEKKDNYEGLKIHSMTIKDKEEEIREKRMEKDAVEQEKRFEEHGGPWKVPESETPQETSEVDPELSVVEVNPVAEKKSSSYVPPHLRYKGAATSVASAPLRGRRAAAPAIENENEFPVLGGPAPDGSGQVRQTTLASGPTINVGNKFSALSSNN